DGITWEAHEFAGKPGHDQNDLKAIAHGNGITVVVGGFFKSNIFTTVDGKSWEKVNYNIGVLSGVVFEDGKFTIMNEGGNMAQSKDGKKWKQVAKNIVGPWAKEEAKRLGMDKLKSNVRMWKYANGTYVGAGDNGVICATSDFKKFDLQKSPGDVKRFRLASNGKVFVAADNNGGKYACYSSDGKKWTSIDVKLSGREKIRDIVFDGERFIMKIQDYGLESTDGKSWKKIKNATFPGTLIVTPKAYFSAGPWYKYTDKPKVSFDKGKTWKECKFPAQAAMRYVLYIED
ncbi:MAG: hypothetical protein NE327_13640, partial [Lentisphaeraceae bacterium]|nr:hypothetical protein [Lentisphaeraceae bacterium]